MEKCIRAILKLQESHAWHAWSEFNGDLSNLRRSKSPSTLYLVTELSRHASMFVLTYLKPTTRRNPGMSGKPGLAILLCC